MFDFYGGMSIVTSRRTKSRRKMMKDALKMLMLIIFVFFAAYLKDKAVKDIKILKKQMKETPQTNIDGEF